MLLLCTTAPACCSADEGQPAACGLPSALLSATQLQDISFGVRKSTSLLFFGALPAALFTSLPALSSIAFLNCGVSGSIPATVSCLTGLVGLDILCAKASGVHPQLHLPSEVSRCSRLDWLAISSASISPSVWQLTALEGLTLDQCSPAAAGLQQMSQLRRLKVLRLCNGGGEVGAALAACTAPPSLTGLLLDGNCLPGPTGARLADSAGTPGPQVQQVTHWRRRAFGSNVAKISHPRIVASGSASLPVSRTQPCKLLCAWSTTLHKWRCNYSPELIECLRTAAGCTRCRRR